MKQQSKLWLGTATLGATALCLAWSWRFTSPQEPLSPADFQEHRAQLEELRVLVHEDVRRYQTGISVKPEEGHTDEKLGLPASRVERYSVLLKKADLDAVSGNQDDSKVWFYRFKNNQDYAFLKNSPDLFDKRNATYSVLQPHWYLFKNR